MTYIMAAMAAVAIYIGSIAMGAEKTHTVVVPNVITEGIVIPDTPVPTPTSIPTPTPIPVDYRELAINDFLSGTALDGMGWAFIYYGDLYGLDPRLMVAVGYHESGLCRHPYGSYNCWGYGPGINFSSYEEGIQRTNATFSSYGLSTEAGLCMWLTGRATCNDPYVNRVLNTLYSIPF